MAFPTRDGGFPVVYLHVSSNQTYCSSCSIVIRPSQKDACPSMCCPLFSGRYMFQGCDLHAMGHWVSIATAINSAALRPCKHMVSALCIL